MTTHDHVISFAAGAFIPTGAFVAGSAIATGAPAVAAGAAGAVGAVAASAASFKPASYFAGLFTGLAAAGGLVYALQADPAEAAAVLEDPTCFETLESYECPPEP